MDNKGVCPFSLNKSSAHFFKLQNQCLTQKGFVSNQLNIEDKESLDVSTPASKGGRTLVE